jgi:hypothetical protein
MLFERNPRGATLAKRASIVALIVAAGVTGSVLAQSGVYHTAGVAAVTLRNKLIAGKSYPAKVLISHKEAVDVEVTLSASNLTAPSSVTVPAGSTHATVNVTAGVAGAASLTASLNSISKTKNVTVANTKLKDIAIAPGQITGGGSRARGSVLLAEISTSAFSVDLSTDDPRLETPATTGVNNGASRSNYFNVTAPAGVDNPVSANVMADVNGTGVSAPMTILPARIRFAKASNEVDGGSQVRVGVELNGRAGPSGKSYTVNSSNPAVIPDGTLVVAANAKSGAVRLTTSTVAVNTTVTLTIPGQPGMDVVVTP